MKNDVKSLKQYIEDEFESQADFARKQGVKPPQVTQWLEKNIIVVGDSMYSFRRNLKK